MFILINYPIKEHLEYNKSQALSKIIDFKITDNLQDLECKKQSIIYNNLLKLKLFFEKNDGINAITFLNNLNNINKLSNTTSLK